MHKIALAVTLALIGPSATKVEPAPVDFWEAPDAPALVMYADPATVDAVCRQVSGTVPAGYVVMACTNPANRTMIMPNPCLYQDEYYARLACHENAHLPRKDGRRWAHPVR